MLRQHAASNQERTDGASVRRFFFLSGRASVSSSALHTDSSHSMSTKTTPAAAALLPQLTVSSDTSGDTTCAQPARAHLQHIGYQYMLSARWLLQLKRSQHTSLLNLRWNMSSMAACQLRPSTYRMGHGCFVQV